MVRVVHQTPSWNELKAGIQKALLLHEDSDSTLILQLSDEGHRLEKIQPDSSLSFKAPYTEKSFIQRLSKSSATQESLLKAVGCLKSEKPSIIDATAGFGIDAFLMAYHHCPVSCIEWNPLVCFLVSQALAQKNIHQQFPFLPELLTFYHNDARLLIPELSPHDVIYLDPMFPERRKQAKVKKYMQMMQMMTALYPWTQQDEKVLFNLALTHAKKRVVVKRPRTEPPLAPHPNHSIFSQSIRFDVYLCQHA